MKPHPMLHYLHITSILVNNYLYGFNVPDFVLNGGEIKII